MEGVCMNILWFLLGLLKGKRHVILDGDGYTFTNENTDGNIVIEEAE